MDFYQQNAGENEFRLLCFKVSKLKFTVNVLAVALHIIFLDVSWVRCNRAIITMLLGGGLWKKTRK